MGTRIITKFFQGISYTDQGVGEVLFFIHGFPLNQSLWDQQISYFSKKFRTISIDLPGLGRSIKPLKQNIRLLDYTKDINLLLKQLKVSNIILIGHSMGGYVALEFCKKYSKRVKALILANTKADADTKEKKQKRVYFISKLKQNIKDEFITDQVSFLRLKDNKEEQRVKEIITTNDPDNLAIILNALVKRGPYWGVLTSLSTPVKLIVGDKDYMLEDMIKIQSTFPIFSLSIIKNAGHMSFLDQPEIFNKTIEEFMIKSNHLG